MSERLTDERLRELVEREEAYSEAWRDDEVLTLARELLALRAALTSPADARDVPVAPLSGAQVATALGHDDPDPALSRHPPPWTFEEYSGGSCIKDADGEWVMGGDSCEGYIDPEVGAFICRMVNTPVRTTPSPDGETEERSEGDECPNHDVCNGFHADDCTQGGDDA